MIEPASTGSDSSSEDEPMEIVKQSAKKQDKKVVKTPAKQNKAEDSGSAKKKHKKDQKSPAVTKVQNKASKTPVDEESSSSEESSDEEPAKPVSKSVVKVRCYGINRVVYCNNLIGTNSSNKVSKSCSKEERGEL